MTGRPGHGTEPVLTSYCDALEALLVEEGMAFHAITATELSRRAGVSRRTFYRYFSTLEDVLDACANRCALEMARRALSPGTQLDDYPARMVFVFGYMDGRRDLLCALKRSDLLPRFLNAFWNTYGPDWVTPGLDLSEQQQKRLAIFATGALSAVIEDWIDDTDAPAPTEMGTVMEELLRAVPQLVELNSEMKPPEGVA